MPDDLPSQVHVAAPELRFRNTWRQRCAWCGALLLEYDMTRTARALQPGEDPNAPWTPALWEPGSLVRSSGTFPVANERVEPNLALEVDGKPVTRAEAIARLRVTEGDSEPLPFDFTLAESLPFEVGVALQGWLKERGLETEQVAQAPEDSCMMLDVEVTR